MSHDLHVRLVQQLAPARTLNKTKDTAELFERLHLPLTFFMLTYNKNCLLQDKKHTKGQWMPGINVMDSVPSMEKLRIEP